jgi:hypothetical protein
MNDSMILMMALAVVTVLIILYRIWIRIPSPPKERIWRLTSEQAAALQQIAERL